MAREFGTDPYGILAAGAPSAGGGGGRGGIGGSGFSVGSVGIPMADVSRAPGNSIGTGKGITFTTSFGGGSGSGTPQDFGRNANVKKKAKGGKVSAAEAVHKHERNMHKGKPLTKMAKGGSTASKRADGCATKGKTKGRFV